MSELRVLRCFLWREFRDQRLNRMIWPIYLVMPLIGMLLPALLAALSAGLLSQGFAESNPRMGSMINLLRSLAGSSGIELDRAAAILMLRVGAAYFLLMPLAIVSIAGAYAIVGDKQQRCLEPLLATPVSTRAYLLGKLLAVLLPAIAMTWISALAGALATTLSFHFSHGMWIWPDLHYWIAVLLLAPLIGAITGLLCLRVSARLNDPQAANQVTALILVPLILLAFSLVGPLLVVRLDALLIACLATALLLLAMYLWVRRGFDREEILCRWN